MLKNVKNQRNDWVMDVFAASVARVPTGDQFLVLLHCVKVVPDGRCYENRSIFFSLVPGAKNKNLYSKCAFLTF